jgi:ribosomal protein L9
MSGIEVIAAVAAIVSAFHGGSELLKHIKTRRRKSRQAQQQELEEKQLQESLVLGEQQIDARYAQDMRDFGDLMRVGDGEFSVVRSP